MKNAKTASFSFCILWEIFQNMKSQMANTFMAIIVHKYNFLKSHGLQSTFVYKQK